MDPGELADLNDAVGEDIDDEKEDAEQDDYMEPTNLQKRELLLQIHRNLGHPEPRELGRDLRNAGAKRHI
eukprot:11396201-Karenia_brevis.AAC.1